MVKKIISLIFMASLLIGCSDVNDISRALAVADVKEGATLEKVETRTSDPRSQDTRDWLQLLVVAFVALSGTYQFVFKDIIRPKKEPTALELSTTMEKVGEQGGMLLIRVGIAAVNPTNRRIYVSAFWFNVRGMLLSRNIHNIEVEEELSNIGSDRLVTVYGQIESSQIVAHQRIVPLGHSWWDPKDKTYNEAVFTVPKDAFDYLEMEVFYLGTRFGDKLLEPDWSINTDGELVADYKLKPSLLGKRNAIKWQEATGSGINWAMTTLPLWDGQEKNGVRGIKGSNL